MELVRSPCCCSCWCRDRKTRKVPECRRLFSTAFLGHGDSWLAFHLRSSLRSARQENGHRLAKRCSIIFLYVIYTSLRRHDWYIKGGSSWTSPSALSTSFFEYSVSSYSFSAHASQFLTTYSTSWFTSSLASRSSSRLLRPLSQAPPLLRQGLVLSYSAMFLLR